MWTIGSACSGIGGIDLGLERADLGRTVWQIEKDAFCRSVAGGSIRLREWMMGFPALWVRPAKRSGTR